LIHTKKIAVLLGFFCVSLGCPVIFAQTQPMVRIYIAPMDSGNPEEQEYFMTNMKMEFTGASYEVVDTPEDSDYNIILSISRREADPEFESAAGGTEAPAEGENPGSMVNAITLTLFDTKTDRELITLSWDYNRLSDMDMWNLYLITQAMANAPITKIPARAALTAPAAEPDSNLQNKLLWFGIETSLGYAYPGDGPYISGVLTLEYDFLPFMGVSMGFGYQALFPMLIDPDNKTYYHIVQNNIFIPVLFRFLFNTGNYLIVPYIGMEFNFGTLGLLPKHALQKTDQIRYIPAIAGGVDFRLAVGPGALDIGGGGIYDFDINAWGVEIKIGYKFGVLTRIKKDQTKEQGDDS
jgi:hypothetical protein